VGRVTDDEFSLNLGDVLPQRIQLAYFHEVPTRKNRIITIIVVVVAIIIIY
jgi:hypothetical protein